MPATVTENCTIFALAWKDLLESHPEIVVSNVVAQCRVRLNAGLTDSQLSAYKKGDIDTRSANLEAILVTLENMSPKFTDDYLKFLKARMKERQRLINQGHIGIKSLYSTRRTKRTASRKLTLKEALEQEIRRSGLDPTHESGQIDFFMDAVIKRGASLLNLQAIQDVLANKRVSDSILEDLAKLLHKDQVNELYSVEELQSMQPHESRMAQVTIVPPDSQDISLAGLVRQEFQRRGLNVDKPADRKTFCEQVKQELNVEQGIQVRVIKDVLEGKQISHVWIGQLAQILSKSGYGIKQLEALNVAQTGVQVA